MIGMKAEAAIQNQVAQKHRKTAYVLLGLIALTLGYIITKDVTIPKFYMAFGALVGGIILLIIGLSRPEIVTYVLVAYLPFSKELAGDFGGFATAFNLTNLLMGFIILVWFTGKYSGNEPLWKDSPLNLPIILFMVVGFIAVMRGHYFEPGYMGYAFINYKRWITPILLYFLVLNTVKERETIKNVAVTMMIATTIVGLMAIYDYMDLGNVSSLEKSRIGGITDQPNMLAAFFNYYMFLPFGFYLMNMSRFRYWLLIVPFLICFRGVMVTFSRGGYIAFAFGLYAIAYFRSKFLFFMLLLVTWIVVLNPILLPAGIRYRMGQTFESQVSYVEDVEDSLESSSKSRIEIWKAGLKMVRDHPFFGVGYGLFPHMLQFYWGGARMDAHNTYLIIAAEMGIPALLIFLWVVWVTFIHSYKLYKSTPNPFAKALALGMLGGLFGLLMSNMFGSRLDAQEVSSYFWILAALIMRLRILDQKTPYHLNNMRYRKLDVFE